MFSGEDVSKPRELALTGADEFTCTVLISMVIAKRWTGERSSTV